MTSFLNKILGISNNNSIQADLKQLGVDMHSHLIPGIDDGVKSLDEAAELIKELKLLGFRKLIITPHIKEDSYRNNFNIINDNFLLLKDYLNAQNIDMELGFAAEYFIDYEFSEKMKNTKFLVFGKNYILIELSYINPPPNLDALIFDMQTNGYRPVMAHVERYPYFFATPDNYQKYKDRGVLFQLNIISLSGYYSIPVKKIAEKLIEQNMIDFLGTDMHNINYLDALKKSLTSRHLIKLINSEKLLNNKL